VSFSDFMSKQCAEMEASGMDEAEWVEQNAETFRANNPVDETE
jgi:hypothetical protein